MADPEESSQQPEELARALSQLSPRLKGLSLPTPGEPWRRQGQGGRGRERGREPGSLPRNRGAGQGRSPLTRSERSSLSLRPLLCADPQLLPFAGPRASQVSCRASHSANAREQKLQARAQLCCPTWRRPAASKSSPCGWVLRLSESPAHGIPQIFLSPRCVLPTRSHVQRPKRPLGICTRTRASANTLGPSPKRKNTRKHVQGLRARPNLNLLRVSDSVLFVCLF